MAKSWSAFYPDVLTELPGAPNPVVDHWLRNAAIEFFDRSKALRIDLTAADAVAEQMEYAPILPANTDLIEILQVLFNDEPLTMKAPAFLSGKYGNWKGEIGTPEHFTQQDGVNVLLVPAPADAAVGAIKIKAAVKPGEGATGIDDWAYSKWRQAIAAGCKGKMMAMANVPWSNTEFASINLAQFEVAISQATIAANKGFTRATPRFSGSFC